MTTGSGGAGFVRGEGDGLTQTDVDRLLQNKGGTSAAGQAPDLTDIAPYNFLRPPRISKDRRMVLGSIFNRAAVSVQSLLSSRLRVVMDVACTVDQATFTEYTMSIASPCAAFVFELGGAAAGQAAIDFSTDLAFFFIDRIFGGPGDPLRLDRPLTTLERTILKGIADRVLAQMAAAWDDNLALEPQVIGFESTPDLLRIASPEDNVLVVNMEVRSGATSGLISACIPLVSLEAFLAEKATGRQGGGPGRPAVNTVARAVVEQRLRAARIDIAARFPSLRLTAKEVAGLTVGQIIATTQAIDAPIELHINGQRRFVGLIGDCQRALGFRITDRIDRASGVTHDRPTRGRIRNP